MNIVLSAETNAGIATTKAGEASVSAGEALVSRNEAEGFRNEAEGFRNEAEGFADSISPDLFATKEYVENNVSKLSLPSSQLLAGDVEVSGVTYTVNTHDVFGDGSPVATYQLDGNANDLGGN
jgi:hypothetical protein